MTSTVLHHPLPFDARAVPGMNFMALAERGRMYPFAYVHTPGARHEHLTRAEMATALFVVGAANAFYQLDGAVGQVNELARAGALPQLPRDLADAIAVAIEAARPATPDAILALLAEGEGPPGPFWGTRPDPADAALKKVVRAAHLLTQGRDGGAPLDERTRYEIHALRDDLIAMVENGELVFRTSPAPQPAPAGV